MIDWDPEQFEFDEAAFTGRARLFPLPDLVLFPHVVQMLHIFEPRYREMVREALDSDRLIATARLEPGWEAGYESRPAVAPVACLGKILSEHRFDDGRFNILLLGMRRIRIVRELSGARAFRTAEVEILHDRVGKADRDKRQCLRELLLKTFQCDLPIGQSSKEAISAVVRKHVPLSVLVDLIAFSADLDAPFKQDLLAETNVVARAEALLERLEEDLYPAQAWPQALGEFPPRFSAN